MRNLFFFLCLMLFNVSLLNAQTGKGNVMLGLSSSYSLMGSGSEFASIGFYSTKSNDRFDDSETTTNINLQPRIGYFLVENLVLGLDISFSLSSSKEDDYKSTDTFLGIGPFARYYFPGENAKPFIEASGSFGSMKDKSESDSYDYTYDMKLTSYGGGAGVAFLVGKKVTLDLMAGYRSYTSKHENTENDSKVTVGSFAVGLGFSILLGAN